jgi:hypothetical protein
VEVCFREVALIGKVGESSCIERYPSGIIDAGLKCPKNHPVGEVYAREGRQERPTHLQKNAHTLEPKGSGKLV